MDGVSKPPIGVVVVGGHPVIRGVVRLACQGSRDLELLAEIDRSDLAADGVLSSGAQVAVIDLDMPDGDGLVILETLVERAFIGRVLVLTDRSDGATVLDALRLGAHGCLAKATGLRSIASAVRRVAAGERLVDPTLERVAVAELGRFVRRARESTEARGVLTTREHEILGLLAHGHTMRQIGRRLGISPRTVETHLGNLYRKLDVGTRVQAVARAASSGLIDLR